MNNLFSSSWKRAGGGGGGGDIESGGGVEMAPPPGAAAGASLDRFFEDVESIKDELRDLERIQRSLHDANEGGKSLHDAAAVRALRARMDADVAAAIKKAKVVKLRLESLDRANAANRSVPGCGPGSSTDRTRTSVVAGLRKKLRDSMESFSSLRARISSEYRETVARRYYTVTGEQPDEATLDNLAETGDANPRGELTSPALAQLPGRRGRRRAMDLRRPPRSSSGGVEPKIRQVGFVTPDASSSAPPAEPPAAAAAAAAAAASAAAAAQTRASSEGSPPASELSPGSLSPVMIPPPRHADHLAPGSPSPVASASELGDDESWSRAPSAAELESNKGDLAEIRNDNVPASIPQKQKTSKAERRAIQEAQRAAKAAAKEAGLSGKSAGTGSGANLAMPKQAKSSKASQKKDVPQAASTAASEKKVTERPSERDRKKDAPHPRMQFDDVHRVGKAKKRAIVNQSEARNRVELFRHLPQYVHGTQLPGLESKFFQLEPMHPSVYKVGLQYLSGEVSGGNGRCIAMLLAFQEAIKDYSTPPKKTLSRDLTAKISSYVSFLIECRPLSISMGNAIRFLKNRIAKLPLTLSESEAKGSLQSDIDRFINEKIVVADKVIVSHAITKVRDNDVLLTYGSSSVVEMILDHAHELGRKFHVIVVDSRPKLEGQGLLRRLVEKGINCTYTHINAISYIMHEVTRVFLGASSILSNGTVYSRVGTASVAMVAHAFGIPVLVCCEAYKFHERVQLDSICANELGDPDVILKVPGKADLGHLKNLADNENLQLLNLTYDATPSDYVSMIITDYGMLPPTSVPVIVREYRKEQLWI